MNLIKKYSIINNEKNQKLKPTRKIKKSFTK